MGQQYENGATSNALACMGVNPLQDQSCSEDCEVDGGLGGGVIDEDGSGGE